MIEPLLSELKRNVVHKRELESIRCSIISGINNPIRDDWLNIILGALSGYGKLDVTADKAIDAAEASVAKKVKFDLDDLDLSVGTIFSDPCVFNMSSNSRLDRLRNTCIAISQLGLEADELIDLLMCEGAGAVMEKIRERWHLQYFEENSKVYLDNHVTTWIEEFSATYPANWDKDHTVAALQELKTLLSDEPIDYNALEADDND